MTELETQPKETITIGNVELILTHPDEVDMEWIGNERLRRQLVAAWMIVDPRDTALNPRLIGQPGIGKTTLGYSVAKSMGREVYIFQCTMDTRPEDLLITPVIAKNNQIAYHASPLVTAMLRGAVAPGGAICIKGPGATSETLTIGKKVTIFAVGGTVTIGQS